MKFILPRTNFVLASSAAVPFLATLAFAFYVNGSLEACALTCAGCIFILLLSWILVRRKRKKEKGLIRLATIEVITAKIPESFIAYVLPLLFAGTNHNNVQLIAFCSVLYLLLLVMGNTVYPSVIFPLMGYKFYRISTENGVTGLLLAKSSSLNLVNSKVKVVELDDCCFMEVS